MESVTIIESMKGKGWHTFVTGSRGSHSANLRVSFTAVLSVDLCTRILKNIVPDCYSEFRMKNSETDL